MTYPSQSGATPPPFPQSAPPYSEPEPWAMGPSAGIAPPPAAVPVPMYVAAPPPPEKTSATLGVVSFVLAILALVIGIGLGVTNGVTMAALAKTTTTQPSDQLAAGFLGTMGAMVIPWLLVLASFIVSIIALVKKSAIAISVIALFIAILAPIAWLLAWWIPVSIATR